MYLTIITTASYILSTIFIIVFIRTYRNQWGKLVEQWKLATKQAQERSAFARKVASLVGAGLKRFDFPNKITVWARDQKSANVKHRMALEKLKASHRETINQRRKSREGFLKSQLPEQRRKRKSKPSMS